MQKLSLAIATLFICSIQFAQAAAVVPTGLQPGDSYYLTFVTRDLVPRGVEQGPAPSNISEYNSFVQNQAALNPSLTGADHGIQWRAVKSIGGVSASQNLQLQEGVPVFLLDGSTMVASGASQWWSGGHSAPINRDQFLNTPSLTNPYVDTSTNIDGTLRPNVGGGTNGGRWDRSDSQWAYVGSIVSSGPRPYLHAYAVSELLVVPVPEPASVVSMLLACIALVGVGLRRRATVGAANTM